MTAATARRWRPNLGDFEGCYVTPRRARTVRAGIEAERWDAVRGGELDVLPHTGRPPWFGIDPPEQPQVIACRGRGPISEHDAQVLAEFAATLRAAAGPSRPCGLCGERPARLYPSGWRCTSCAPPAAPTPDPARTAAGLRAKKGQR